MADEVDIEMACGMVWVYTQVWISAIRGKYYYFLLHKSQQKMKVMTVSYHCQLPSRSSPLGRTSDFMTSVTSETSATIVITARCMSAVIGNLSLLLPDFEKEQQVFLTSEDVNDLVDVKYCCLISGH